MSVTSTLYATGATAVTGTWGTLTDATGSTASTYATWTSTVSGEAAGVELTGYNFSSLVGAGDTVGQVGATIKWYTSTATARIASATAQLYSGTTPIGAAVALTVGGTSANSQAITFPTAPTYAQLSDLRVRLSFTRAVTTFSSTVNVDYVGAQVTYTPAAPATVLAMIRRPRSRSRRFT